MTYTLDAKGKILGRIASEAAILLMGKNEANFTRHKLSQNKVEIINAAKMKINPKKLANKVYSSYSGYPGGLQKKTMARLSTEKGFREILSLAIYGMLPNNKLRVKMMANLKIDE